MLWNGFSLNLFNFGDTPSLTTIIIQTLIVSKDAMGVWMSLLARVNTHAFNTKQIQLLLS